MLKSGELRKLFSGIVQAQPRGHKGGKVFKLAVDLFGRECIVGYSGGGLRPQANLNRSIQRRGCALETAGKVQGRGQLQGRRARPDPQSIVCRV